MEIIKKYWKYRYWNFFDIDTTKTMTKKERTDEICAKLE